MSPSPLDKHSCTQHNKHTDALTNKYSTAAIAVLTPKLLATQLYNPWQKKKTKRKKTLVCVITGDLSKFAKTPGPQRTIWLNYVYCTTDRTTDCATENPHPLLLSFATPISVWGDEKSEEQICLKKIGRRNDYEKYKWLEALTAVLTTTTKEKMA